MYFGCEQIYEEENVSFFKKVLVSYEISLFYDSSKVYYKIIFRQQGC